MDISKVKEIINQIFNQFIREEIGNRITNFNLNALRLFIIEKIEESAEVKHGQNN